ncbi:MAG: TraR/DksA C4-type zinc finger protein [Thermomicrobiales bacterium]|nr:TraR/DksA C4-type zinc finger protein [Thermomicrobiales bacterium]
MENLDLFLRSSAERHDHLCPRQVLGVRMGMLGGRLLGLSLPQRDKRLLVITETDGCFCDGIEVSTGCSVGHRTLRVEDFGKVAVTFIDTERKSAVRVIPHPQARDRAAAYVPPGGNRWEGQLIGYQRLPDDLLLAWTPVESITPIETLVGKPGVRAICDLCHEEILNRREIVLRGVTLCRACAGQQYYRPCSTAVADFRSIETTRAS